MIINKDEILNSISLEDIISKYVELKRTGTTLKGNCPFHEEKTPSFSVSPAKGVFKCFGCGEGGNNPASFLMKLPGKNYTFPEALQEIADLKGITVRYDSGNKEEWIRKEKEERSHKQELRKALGVASDFYTSNNPITYTEGGDVMIAGKLYSKKTVEEWKIFLTGDAHQLAHADVPMKNIIQELKVIMPSSKGTGFYDYFFKRAIFPYFDKDGIFAWNGRDLLNDETKNRPKYINSHDNPLIYSKENSLFGLWKNQTDIRKAGYTFLVEGPTDVIQMWQQDVRNVVAACGTSFTAGQAALLAQVTDVVVILMDGDNAGLKKIPTIIDLLIEAQLEPKVLILPDGMDPAQYLVEHGAEAFLELQESKEVDGLEYRVEKSLGNKSQHDLLGSLMLTSGLIAKVKSDQMRMAYIGNTAIQKMLNVTQSVLKDAVKKAIDDCIKDSNKLTDEQQHQLNMFGFYASKNKYIAETASGTAYHLSNFVILPIFIVKMKENSLRVFEIVNEYGEHEVVMVKSNDFISLTGFKQVVENAARCVFFGKDEHYTKLKQMIYAKMYNIIPIKVLGYHNEGFFAWSNGITTPDGEFHHINEYGQVEYKGVKYFLPTFSTIGKIDGDEDSIDDEFERTLKYIPSKKSSVPKSIKEWASQWKDLSENDALVCISYIFASFYRDIIKNTLTQFPLLNIFGEAGSGKTFLADVIKGCYGIPAKGMHAVSSTKSSFFRRIGQARNIVFHYEEFSDKTPPEFIEGFKQFADGLGRSLSDAKSEVKTKTTAVHSACLITGQTMSVADPALPERMVTIFTKKIRATDDQKERAETFHKWAESGFFSFVSAELLKYREHFEKEFESRLNDTRRTLTEALEDNTIATRVINNFSIMLTAYKLIGSKVQLPWKDIDVLDYFCRKIKEQSKVVAGSEEINGFWSALEYLIDNGKQSKPAGPGITTDHYAVETRIQVSLTKEGGGSEVIDFSQPKQIIYVRLNYVHQKYTEVASNKKAGNRVLDLPGLKHYLKNTKAFIGFGAKKFGKTSQRCMIFSVEDIVGEFEFENTYYGDPSASSGTEEEFGGYERADRVRGSAGSTGSPTGEQIEMDFDNNEN